MLRQSCQYLLLLLLALPAGTLFCSERTAIQIMKEDLAVCGFQEHDAKKILSWLNSQKKGKAGKASINTRKAVKQMIEVINKKDRQLKMSVLFTSFVLSAWAYRDWPILAPYAKLFGSWIKRGAIATGSFVQQYPFGAAGVTLVCVGGGCLLCYPHSSWKKLLLAGTSCLAGLGCFYMQLYPNALDTYFSANSVAKIDS